MLSDAKGRVHALWASYSSGHGKSMHSFFIGIPIERVIEIIARGIGQKDKSPLIAEGCSWMKTATQ